MDIQHFSEKRRDVRKSLRVKIVTNKQINFITAIRPDSTVTDLANRALNVYLELVGQHLNGKQMTIAAVKQGRFFMPKSQIVSNLLSQDEQVQVIIVKAKPKFPKQIIPNQHDYEYLSKYLRPFQGLRQIKKAKNLMQSEVKEQKVESKSYSKIQILQKQDSLKSKTSNHAQLSKKERKKKKKMQKQAKSAEKKALSINNSIQHSVVPAKQISLEAKKDIIQQKKQQMNNSVKNSSVHPIQKPKETNHIQPNESSNIKEYLKKQIKNDKSDSIGTPQHVPRKISVDNRSQKSDINKLNPLQSPTITFHKNNLQSPKVLYLPQSKNMSELKLNIEKEKEKLRINSPLIIPKSPKISLLQKEPKLISSQLTKTINSQNQIKSDLRIIHKTKSVDTTVNQSLTKNQQNTKRSNSNNQSRTNIILNDSKSKKQREQMVSSLEKISISQTHQQHHIIEEQSESQQIVIMTDGKNQSIKEINGVNSKQGDTQTVKKKNNNSKHYEIDSKINQFKLEQSDQEQ